MVKPIMFVFYLRIYDCYPVYVCREALPDSPVVDVQMAYDVHRLVSLRNRL